MNQYPLLIMDIARLLARENLQLYSYHQNPETIFFLKIIFKLFVTNPFVQTYLKQSYPALTQLDQF